MKINSKFNYIIVAIIIGIFISLVFTVSVTADVRVEPSRYIIYTRPEARVTESVNVTNNSDETVDLVANFYDWDMNEEYDLETHDLGTLDSSLDGYFQFNPRKFSLPPGETQTVRFTIDIPKDEDDEERRERRGIIFFEHEEDLTEDGEIGAKLVKQIGTTVYAIPEDLGYTLNILESRVVKNEEGQIFGAFLTENTGKRHLRFDLDYTLISKEGKEIEQDKVEEKVLLANMERGVVFPLDNNLEPGEYQLKAEFSFPDAEEKLNETVDFNIGDN
ncbi:MAG: hypothetical protein ACOC4G_07170 [Bacillota bacterium]